MTSSWNIHMSQRSGEMYKREGCSKWWGGGRQEWFLLLPVTYSFCNVLTHGQSEHAWNELPMSFLSQWRNGNLGTGCFPLFASSIEMAGGRGMSRIQGSWNPASPGDQTIFMLPIEQGNLAGTVLKGHLPPKAVWPKMAASYNFLKWRSCESLTVTDP